MLGKMSNSGTAVLFNVFKGVVLLVLLFLSEPCRAFQPINSLASTSTTTAVVDNPAASMIVGGIPPLSETHPEGDHTGDDSLSWDTWSSSGSTSTREGFLRNVVGVGLGVAFGESCKPEPAHALFGERLDGMQQPKPTRRVS